MPFKRVYIRFMCVQKISSEIIIMNLTKKLLLFQEKEVLAKYFIM